MDRVDKSLLGADLEQAREQLRESTAGIIASQRHPHEPELPATFDAAGRCVVCWLLSEVERLRYGLEEIASFPISGYHAGAAQRIAQELLNNQTVTKRADSPITEERPRDVGAPGAAT